MTIRGERGAPPDGWGGPPPGLSGPDGGGLWPSVFLRWGADARSRPSGPAGSLRRRRPTRIVRFSSGSELPEP